MKNLLERGKDIVNVIGILCGSMALLFLGLQINNLWIFFFGGLSLDISLIFFIGNVLLLIRDYIQRPREMV